MAEFICFFLQSSDVMKIVNKFEKIGWMWNVSEIKTFQPQISYLKIEEEGESTSQVKRHFKLNYDFFMVQTSFRLGTNPINEN